MRCLCCNRNLSDYESTLRRADNNEFVDICVKCLVDIPIETIGRSDLSPYEDMSDDNELVVEEGDDDEDG